MELLSYNEIENLYVSGPILDDIEQFLKRIVLNLREKDECASDVTTPHDIQSANRIRGKYCRKSSQKCYNDSVVIVASNCGIGIKSNDYYKELFEKVSPTLEKNNCHVLFVRGNYDNPSFYDEHFGARNLICVKDYTVVKCKNFNVLCIGGGISIDRSWKKIQEERINKKLYFENENVSYDSKEIEDIVSHYDISCVVTCTSPSFAYPSTNNVLATKWVNNDKSLSDDLMKERVIMDKIYSGLILGNKPYIWFYGKFNQSQKSQVNDILFNSLSKNNILSFNELMEEYFGVSLTKNKSKKHISIGYSSSVFDLGVFDTPQIKVREEYLDERPMPDGRPMIDVDDLEEENNLLNEEYIIHEVPNLNL